MGWLLPRRDAAIPGGQMLDGVIWISSVWHKGTKRERELHQEICLLGSTVNSPAIEARIHEERISISADGAYYLKLEAGTREAITDNIILGKSKKRTLRLLS